MDVLDYHAANQASISSFHYSGDRVAAVVLDVGCGT